MLTNPVHLKMKFLSDLQVGLRGGTANHEKSSPSISGVESAAGQVVVLRNVPIEIFLLTNKFRKPIWRKLDKTFFCEPIIVINRA